MTKVGAVAQKNQKQMHYFSFGQSHVHRVNNTTFDLDCLVGIMAIDKRGAREIMVEFFGLKWSNQYGEKDLPNIMKYFPRGIIELEPQS